MSLSHDGYDYESAPHGIVMPDAPWEIGIIEGKFFGLRNVAHIISETWGRNLSCQLVLDGYEDRAALKAALDTLEGKAGQLTGDLVVSIDGTETFEDCTFLGFQPTAPSFFDGAGNWGWVQFGRLFWRQRTR